MAGVRTEFGKLIDVLNFMSISLEHSPATHTNQLPWINNQEVLLANYFDFLNCKISILVDRVVTIETYLEFIRQADFIKVSLIWVYPQYHKNIWCEKKKVVRLPFNTMLWSHSRHLMKCSIKWSCKNKPAFCCSDFWRLFALVSSSPQDALRSGIAFLCIPRFRSVRFVCNGGCAERERQGKRNPSQSVIFHSHLPKRRLHQVHK